MVRARSAEGFRRGVEYLTQAIRIDPHYAPAYAELAQCISVPCYYGAVDPNVAYPKARVAACVRWKSTLIWRKDMPSWRILQLTTELESRGERVQTRHQLESELLQAHYHYSYFLAELGRR